MTAAERERETTIADAATSEGKTPAERMRMFAGILEMVDAVWKGLPPEERRRRMEISRKLHQRPEPWWKNVRSDALPVSGCPSSST